ncbi:hypothetical protein ACFFWC_15920 [Plantactinospora siamensis]|uniref:Uncharacterized protein n=1 Tax=Plantactinospora siamensis TaxID=555372 RepID=A0ABV6NXR3_9ACTN
MPLTPPSDPAEPALFTVDPPPAGTAAQGQAGAPGRRGASAPSRTAGASGPSRTPAGAAGSVPQPSLFGVAAVEPSIADLAGLLAGPGQLDRMGGTVRVSVLVDDPWRVHVLMAELDRRGLVASWSRADHRYGVRTSYTVGLAALGRGWLAGGTKRPPAGFHLDGPRLRLWTAAAGEPDGDGFVLRLGAADTAWWPLVGGALAAVGLPADLVPAGAAGPAYRIEGRRGTARLAELVGERPPAAPPGRWPGTVAGQGA